MPLTSTTRRPIGVRLADVLTTVCPPTADVYATSCTDRAGSVRRGDVYVAPDVESNAALPRVEQAIAAGASAVVVGQLLPAAGAPQFVVDDPRTAFGRLCHALAGSPASDLPTTAIAGVYGKSSVARLLRSIYRCAGHEAALLDNGSLHDGCDAREAGRGALSPAAVASWLSRSVANGCSAAIAEAAADERFSGSKFQSVCVTNLGCVEPPRGLSPESFRAEQRRVVNHLEPAGTLVVNADDQECCRLLSTWGGAALTFGSAPTADVVVQVLERHAGGQVLLLRYGADAVAIETSTVGDAHAQNCAAAAATALAAGIPLAEIAAGIESAAPAALVMQSVVCGQSFPVYLDAARSSRSVADATASVGAVTSGRVLTVLPEGVAIGSAVVHAAESNSEMVFLPGDASQATPGASLRLVEDRFSGVALAIALAEPGDAVVVLGCKQAGSTLSAEERIVRQLLRLRLENEPPQFAAAS